MKNKTRFKSLRQKMLIVYFGIIIGTFILLSSILPYIISSYFVNSQEAILLRQGKALANIYEKDSISHGGLFELLEQGNILDTVVQSETWFVSVDTGNIITTSIDQGKLDLNDPIITEVLKGNAIRIVGDFFGHFDQQVLTVGIPLRINGVVRNIMFLHKEMDIINKSVTDMQVIISFVLAISLFVAMILIYILSKDIIDPINQMNKAAKKMASGNFNTKLRINSDDEVGQLAKSFNHMSSELGRLEEMRSTFIANISHDFRSPLTSIRGFVQAILDGTIPSEMHGKYLTVVMDETDRLTKMTNDILHLTKMESNQIELHKSNFDINEVMCKVLIGMEQRITAKDIHVKLNFAEEKIFVHGDIEQIQRVIYNLLDNAIKFVGDGDEIFLESTIIKKKVHVSIIDTGPGIDAKSLNKIFDRFHKGDPSRGMDKKGTGLGLAIVKEIIKLHGEEISVSSREGEGTAFNFTMELVTEKEGPKKLGLTKSSPE